MEVTTLYLMMHFTWVLKAPQNEQWVLKGLRQKSKQIDLEAPNTAKINVPGVCELIFYCMDPTLCVGFWSDFSFLDFCFVDRPPSNPPTALPTTKKKPTSHPTNPPTRKPTTRPTNYPTTTKPTKAPTNVPTTAAPTLRPTAQPTPYCQTIYITGGKTSVHRQYGSRS